MSWCMHFFCQIITHGHPQVFRIFLLLTIHSYLWPRFAVSNFRQKKERPVAYYSINFQLEALVPRDQRLSFFAFLIHSFLTDSFTFVPRSTSKWPFGSRVFERAPKWKSTENHCNREILAAMTAHFHNKRQRTSFVTVYSRFIECLLELLLEQQWWRKPSWRR